MSGSLKTDESSGMKSKRNVRDPEIRDSSKERHWIPPPALTSKQQTKKTKHSSKGMQFELKSDTPDNEDLNFEQSLQDLLLEIRQLQSDATFEDKEKDLIEQRKHFINSKQADKGSKTTVHKTIEEMRASQEAINHRSLDAMKDELQKNADENERLTRRQEILMDKLSRVERNATQALQHMVSLREGIQKLSKDGSGGDQQGIPTKESNQKFNKDMLTRLKQLDQANQSLQALIHATSNANVTIDASTPNSENDDNSPNSVQKLHLHKLTSQVKSLQNQVEEDHEKISELQRVVHKTKLAALEEKEELQKSVKFHKDRAEKYLSSVDTLKMQLSRKTNELSDLKPDISSLKLKIARLTSERDRLEIEKTTLSGKLVATDLQTRNHNLAITSQLEDISSKLFHSSSKSTQLEAENENLKLLLTGSKNEVDRFKSELQKRNEELQDMHNKMLGQSSNKALNKSAQATTNGGTPSHVGTDMQSQFGQDQWLQMTEFWKQLQSDKLNILQTLKDLESKLGKSQESNLEIRQELSHKENLMQEINIRLQEKIEENKSLKQLLESALSDAKKYSEQAIEKCAGKEQMMQTQMAELERQLQDCKKENIHLRKSNSELEKNFSLQINELQERLDLADKSKKTMHDYIAFLKSSYANVFGEGSLATKNYPF